MSTSLLYHGWGIRGHCKYVRSDYQQGQVGLTVTIPEHRWRCSHCQAKQFTKQGSVERTWRMAPIGSCPVYLKMDVPRIYCKSCKKTRQITLPFADEKKRYTTTFARYALELAQNMTIQATAQHLGVGWDLIKEIIKERLTKRFRNIPLKHVTKIAIDEICIGKGYRFITIVLDLGSGAVIFIGDGKGADALLPFWKKIKAARANIQAVASDMSPAYVGAIMTHLPKARHVLDRFHVMKLFNDKLADLRRQLFNLATTVEKKQLIKGTRWLLLKNKENLDSNKGEDNKLKEALRINEPLSIAYYLKEDLRLFWNQANRQAAETFLDHWLEKTGTSSIRQMIIMAKTLRLHSQRLLDWYHEPISTAPLEGTNNKIKTMQRQAYGYRDQEFFRLKIHAIHEANYALVG